MGGDPSRQDGRAERAREMGSLVLRLLVASPRPEPVWLGGPGDSWGRCLSAGQAAGPPVAQSQPGSRHRVIPSALRTQGLCREAWGRGGGARGCS